MKAKLFLMIACIAMICAACEPIGGEPNTSNDYVDLGLSSGTKWATCNVGAKKPYELGDYFAWGETKSKKKYQWDTYSYCTWEANEGYIISIDKYCTNEDYGNVDDKKILELSDDAACAKLGKAWRMPTKSEFYELHKECKWTWYYSQGVGGYKVTGPNGNSIFLPAAGYINDEEEYDERPYAVGWFGAYWSSTLYEKYPDNAYCLTIFEDGDYTFNETNQRYLGFSIRPVLDEFYR